MGRRTEHMQRERFLEARKGDLPNNEGQLLMQVGPQPGGRLPHRETPSSGRHRPIVLRRSDLELAELGCQSKDRPVPKEAMQISRLSETFGAPKVKRRKDSASNRRLVGAMLTGCGVPGSPSRPQSPRHRSRGARGTGWCQRVPPGPPRAIAPRPGP